MPFQPHTDVVSAYYGAQPFTIEEGYRFEVEGGHVLYNLEHRTLEIAATESDEIHGEGRIVRTLEGHFEGALDVEGEGRYYDDGYGGRTREVGEREAKEAAERNVEAAVRAPHGGPGRDRYDLTTRFLGRRPPAHP